MIVPKTQLSILSSENNIKPFKYNKAFNLLNFILKSISSNKR